MIFAKASDQLWVELKTRFLYGLERRLAVAECAEGELSASSMAGYAGGLTRVRVMTSLVWMKASGCRAQASQRYKRWGAMKGQPS